MTELRSRLYLVTPREFHLDTFTDQLKDAISGGDIAALLIDASEMEISSAQNIAETLVSMAHEHDIAVLYHGDTRIMGRAKCDGLHISEENDNIEKILEDYQPDAIVGVGGIRDRHHAMSVASAGVDYLFFGRLDIEQKQTTHKQTGKLSYWWASMFEIPAVMVAGSSYEAIEEAAQNSVEFIAIREQVWNSEEKPSTVVSKANAIFDRIEADRILLEAQNKAAARAKK